MSSFVITCPNPACAKPLNLPAAAVGRPLSCPHCRTGIGVALGPDGTPTAPTVVPTRRVPAMFLVPAFALIILGAGSLFGHGYIAGDIFTRPDASREYARLMLNYARDAEQSGKPADAVRGKQEADPFDPFGAALGGAGVASVREESDEARARAAWWVGPACLALALLGLVMAAGGVAMVLGRWYWLAAAGCVAAFLSINPCCCVPGAVAGLWGGLMLARDDGRRHFGR